MLTKLSILFACMCVHMVSYAVQQDPTRPPSVIAQQLAPLQEVRSDFQLSAIFTRQARRYAVVNGEVLKTGDNIMGMRVHSIDGSQVVLSDPTFSESDIVLEVQNSSGMSKQVVK